MKRREFIGLVGGAAVWPVAARAQQRSMPTIGFLGAATASLQRPWTNAFVQRLGERGWIEGQTVAMEYRWAEARREQVALHLDEFRRLKVDIIVTHPDAAVLMAKQMASAIPIVFPVVNDPVEMGIVASLAKPGGNATGLSCLTVPIRWRCVVGRQFWPTRFSKAQSPAKYRSNSRRS
jgi:putative tryptophan/tyrosine transport system substrate-binding protein